MTREHLAFVADALIALCQQDEEQPYLRDEDFEVRLRQERLRLPLYEQLVRKTGDDGLLREECELLLERADFTRQQRDVFFLRLEGRSFSAIGMRLQLARVPVQRIFSTALKKIAHARRVYPYAGLADVYHREVRRNLRPKSKRVQ